MLWIFLLNGTFIMLQNNTFGQSSSTRSKVPFFQFFNFSVILSVLPLMVFLYNIDKNAETFIDFMISIWVDHQYQRNGEEEFWESIMSLVEPSMISVKIAMSNLRLTTIWRESWAQMLWGTSEEQLNQIGNSLIMSFNPSLPFLTGSYYGHKMSWLYP